MNSNSAKAQANPASRVAQGRVGFLGVFGLAWAQRELIYRLTRREIESRYRGSILGLVWLLLIPLFMLGVYTLVFRGIFHSRWEGTDSPFFLILFSGLILANIFSECVGRAPGLVLGNVAYVKRVVFPLDILAFVTLGAALFDAVVSFAVLFAIYVPLLGLPPASALWLPVVTMPLILLTLGLVWIVAALGVYLRDLRQVVMVVLMALPFLCPLFFPLTAFGHFGAWTARVIKLNPLTIPLIELRQILFFHQTPDWIEWAGYALVAWSVAYLGLAWFRYAQRGFADVV
jgi:lipopolysaccharide transport system permease protein